MLRCCVPYWKTRARRSERLLAGQVLGDRQSQRLLDVGTLARPGGEDRNRHVPMVGRGHDDGVDIVAGQQFSEVLVGRPLADRRQGFASIPVAVGDGHTLGVAQCLEPAKQIAAASPDANVSHGDAVAGRCLVLATQGSRRNDVGCRQACCRRTTGLQQLATIQSIFVHRTNSCCGYRRGKRGRESSVRQHPPGRWRPKTPDPLSRHEPKRTVRHLLRSP